MLVISNMFYVFVTLVVVKVATSGLSRKCQPPAEATIGVLPKKLKLFNNGKSVFYIFGDKTTLDITYFYYNEIYRIPCGN